MTIKCHYLAVNVLNSMHKFCDEHKKTLHPAKNYNITSLKTNVIFRDAGA